MNLNSGNRIPLQTCPCLSFNISRPYPYKKDGSTSEFIAVLLKNLLKCGEKFKYILWESHKSRFT
jgi:hypothetical protein